MFCLLPGQVYGSGNWLGQLARATVIHQKSSGFKTRLKTRLHRHIAVYCSRPGGVERLRMDTVDATKIRRIRQAQPEFSLALAVSQFPLWRDSLAFSDANLVILLKSVHEV
jgi:hypothetical protein